MINFEKNWTFWKFRHFWPHFQYLKPQIFVKNIHFRKKLPFKTKNGWILAKIVLPIFFKFFKLFFLLPPPCGDNKLYIRLLWRVFWSGLSTFQIIHFCHFISPRSRSVPVIKRRSSRLASFSSFRDSKLYRIGFHSRFMSHSL